MNVFDSIIATNWKDEQEQWGGPAAGAYSRIVADALDWIYDTRPQADADEIVYRSDNFSRVSVGTALEIQRRVVLKILDKVC